MGQAKLRGTLEERQKQGEEKRRLEAEARHKKYLEREAALTPLQRQQRKTMNTILTAAMGVAVAGSGLPGAVKMLRR